MNFRPNLLDFNNVSHKELFVYHKQSDETSQHLKFKDTSVYKGGMVNERE